MIVASTKVGDRMRRFRRRDRRADKIARVLAELEVALKDRPSPARPAPTLRLARR